VSEQVQRTVAIRDGRSAHIEALELENRVRLRLEDDHVGVWPDERRDRETPREASR
jgi:hypothetical protein